MEEIGNGIRFTIIGLLILIPGFVMPYQPTAGEKKDVSVCRTETVRLQPLRINTTMANRVDSAGRRTGLWVSVDADSTVRTTNYFAGKRNGLDSWYEYVPDSGRHFLATEAMYYAGRLEQITMWRPGVELRSLVTEIAPTDTATCGTVRQYRGYLHEFDSRGRMTSEGEVVIRDSEERQPLLAEPIISGVGHGPRTYIENHSALPSYR